MRKLNWSGLILDLIYIALGIVFIIHPEGVESVLCYILAAAVAVIGLLYLIGFFIQKADESGRREGNGFAIGILLIILAVFIVVKQTLVISLVPFLFGVMVAIRGLMVIQEMFHLRRLGVRPLIPLISGLVTMALGLFVMLFPFQTATMLFVLIGVGLLVGGLMGIGQEIVIWHQSRRQYHEQERQKDMEGARTVQVYEADAEESDIVEVDQAETDEAGSPVSEAEDAGTAAAEAAPEDVNEKAEPAVEEAAPAPKEE